MAGSTQTAGSWPLPDHVGRVLVVAQAEVARMAELPGRGPFGEADLADQARLDPVHCGSRQIPAGEGGRGALDPLQGRVQRAERPLIETGSHLARVHQAAALVV